MTKFLRHFYKVSALLTPSVSAEEEKTPAQSDKDPRRLVAITTYFQQSYQIHSIVWDKTPTTHKMLWKRRENGKIFTSDLSLAQYLEAKYGVRGLDPKQPLLSWIKYCIEYIVKDPQERHSRIAALVTEVANNSILCNR